MILQKDGGEVETLGDVQKFKVSIDERNLSHIVTILSSNLYSYPMKSFLRETISNAVDSHTEAGSKEPIVVTITDDSISVRDFGTGISPETFKEIYINIGSSTKRDSNNYIGSFGIGRFSCLAVADLANITSYYNGRAYYYVMNKDIDQLHIDLLMEEATTEPNGVEVKVPNKIGVKREDLNDLYFIKNLYMNSKTSDSYMDSILQRFNNRKLFDYESFKIVSVEGYAPPQEGFKILIGNVLYSVNYSTILDTLTLENWGDTLRKIYPCLTIGSVDITPNRESLLYSDRTKKRIKEVVEACIKKLTDLWNAEQNEIIDDIKILVHTILSYNNNEICLDSIKIPLSPKLSHKVKYKNKVWDFKDCKDIISTLQYGYKYVQGGWFLGEYSMNSFSKVISRHFNFFNLLNNLTDLRYKVFILPNDHGFTSTYFRPFLNDSYYNYHVLFLRNLHITPSSLERIMLDIWTFEWSKDSKSKETRDIRDIMMTIVKDSLRYFREHAIVEDVFNSKEFLQYKKEHRHKVKRNTEVSRFFIWIPERDKSWTYTGTAKQVINILHDAPYKNFRIVYASVDSLLLSSLESVYKRLIVIKLNKTLYKSAKAGELFPDYIQEVDALYEPDNRYLQKLATIHYLRKEHSEECFSSPLKAFPKDIQEKMNTLRALNKEYPVLKFTDAFTRAVEEVPKEKYDLEILSLFHETLYYQKFSADIISKEIDCDSLFWYNVLKAKCFLLDKGFYQSLKYSVAKNVNFITVIKNYACH